MKKKFVLGVIGAGFMSSAIINGIINTKCLKKNQIIVSDLSNEALARMNKLGVRTTKENITVANNCEYLLFAIKPQHFSDVATKVCVCDVKKIISIMAGVKKEKIKKYFNNALVCRCMPNTPCSIGEGAVGIDALDYTDKKDLNFIENIFSSFAKVSYLPEEKISAVTGISGSSPAYFYLFAKGIIDAGVKNGLDYDVAVNLAVTTMIGSGKMILKNKEKTLDELITAVCSKGGTTIEAINVFNENKLTDICKKAIDACIKRSKELEDTL